MSIIETLTEGIVNRDMKKEGSALLSKWTKTGLLEGLQNEQQKHTMARLLENQAKELLREASSMGNGDVEGFAAVAFPIVRRVFAGLIANDLVSVQPMSLPSGLIFFLDFAFSPDAGGGSGTMPRLGNASNASVYGTNRLASEVTGGVSIVGSQGEDLSGPRGMVGYSYSSPSGSSEDLTNNTIAECAEVLRAKLDGNISEAIKKLIQYDADLLAETTTGVVAFDVAETKLDNATSPSHADYDNLSAFQWTVNTELLAAINDMTDVTGVDAVGEVKQIRRLTKRIAAGDAGTGVASVRFFFTITNGSDISSDSTTAEESTAFSAGAITYPIKDNLAAGGALGGIKGDNYALENNANIPEIDIKVDSIAITAQTKKLKAKWTPELGQDLNAYHNLDAEVELTSILSEQIALEIDREILADLVNGAKAGTFYWSRSPGLFVNRVTGAEIGATAAAPDFTGTVSEWYETLIETMNDVSAQIHRKTLRGGANFCVVSPEVANILEFTAGFRANVTADADKGEIGAVKIGSLSRKFDVIVDPYFPRNVVLMGRKGNSFLESGYVYAPYVPLQTTPTIFGVEDFVPRKGVMTRYAKKMVRPDMYGLVIVRGLLGESGAS
jgi:hypothetical protein